MSESRVKLDSFVALTIPQVDLGQHGIRANESIRIQTTYYIAGYESKFPQSVSKFPRNVRTDRSA